MKLSGEWMPLWQSCPSSCNCQMGYCEHVISVSSHLVISLLVLSLQFFFLPFRHPLGWMTNRQLSWVSVVMMMTKISVVDWNSNPSRKISPCRLTKGGGIQLKKSMFVSSCKYAHDHIFGKKRRSKSVEELRKTPQRKMGSKIYRGGSEEWETKQYCEALLRWRACLQPELPDVTDLRFWSNTKSQKLFTQKHVIEPFP